jgi:hypothetical protein
MFDKTISDCIDWLVSTIETTTGGRAQDYERRVVTEDDLVAVAGVLDGAGNMSLHGWTVTVENDDAEVDPTDGQNDSIFTRMHTVVLRGYMGLNDELATGRTWGKTIIPDLETAIDAAPTLGGNADKTSPCFARIRDQHAEIGNYLVHYCEIVVPVGLRRKRV